MNQLLKNFALLISASIFLWSCGSDVKQVEKKYDYKSTVDVDKFVEVLGEVSYATREEAFSPLFSEIGIMFQGSPGITDLYYVFNRESRALKNVLEIDAELIDSKSDVLGVEQIFKKGNAKYAFYAQNSFLVEINDIDSVKFNFTIPETIALKEWKPYDNVPWIIKKGDICIFRGYNMSPNTRDPDFYYPVALAIKVIEGSIEKENARGLSIKSKDDKIVLAVSTQMLELDYDELADKLNRSPNNIEIARNKTKEWFAETLGNLPLNEGLERERKVAAVAAMTLACNSCTPQGMMKGHIASYSNKGTYPTHFQWDVAFSNLGVEMMNPKMAEDAMLIMTETTRADGKMGQFITSTWLRPFEIQVPLVGWASERLYRQRGNKDFIKKILYPLVKNCEWILGNRMTRHGLVSALTPFELWDDTPRLDDGPILPCDFNADLLMQMRACEFFANEIGDIETAAKCKKMGDEFAQKMFDILYDPVDNIFRDVLVETGEQMSILTPACFIPLLADLPISDEKAKDMIRKYLLDENKFFGKIPFPSVAYDEPEYIPEKSRWELTWRGATWMPLAWFMLEILDKYGFDEEYKIAMDRIYDMMLEDGQLSELFNSQNGKGLGVPRYGWTAGIFLKMKSVREKKPNNSN